MQDRFRAKLRKLGGSSIQYDGNLFDTLQHVEKAFVEDVADQVSRAFRGTFRVIDGFGRRVRLSVANLSWELQLVRDLDDYVMKVVGPRGRSIGDIPAFSSRSVATVIKGAIEKIV